MELLEKTRDPTVRISAIEALGAVGDREDIDSLIRILQSADRAEQTAAAKSLIRLEGGDVSREITQVMNGADSKLRVQLIEILAQRRAFESVEELLNAARDQEATVRQAAMKALGKLATPEQVGGMIQGVLAAEPGAERGAAEKQVMIVANRIEDPQQRAAPILAAMKRMDRQDRLAILSVVGRVGGSEARQVIEQEIANRDALRHSAGIRAIANWPTAEIAPRLFELAERDPHRSHRITALRAAIRVAPLPDERSDAQRLALLKKAMEMATRDAERILILDRSRAVRIPETLRFVLPYVGKPPLSEQACLTVVELAHHRELREANKAEFHRALDKVIAATKDPVIIDRANRYKRNQTWVRPK